MILAPFRPLKTRTTVASNPLEPQPASQSRANRQAAGGRGREGQANRLRGMCAAPRCTNRLRTYLDKEKAEVAERVKRNFERLKI